MISTKTTVDHRIDFPSGSNEPRFRFRRLRWIVISAACFSSLVSSASAQIGGAPAGTSPTIDTDVSSLIATGSGYDAWTGSVRRHVVDFEVPGALSEHGLKWERTYNSSASGGWSFAYTWRILYRPYFQTQNAIYPDGRQSHFEVGTKERYFQTSDTADLYLDDGSVVHFSRHSDWVDGDPPQGYWVDYYTPLWLTDRYGRRTTLDWEFCGSYPDSDNIRLRQVTDPSGRWIKIDYDPVHVNSPTLVYGSDGQWVSYTWPSGSNTEFRADYSDGDFRDL